MEKLKNCPNCGGYINDSGRCNFCGSKIYDFVDVNFDKCDKTYIRMKSNGKIMTYQVIFHTANIDIHSEPINTDDLIGMPFTLPYYRRTGVLEFDIIGDMICEDGDKE